MLAGVLLPQLISFPPAAGSLAVLAGVIVTLVAVRGRLALRDVTFGLVGSAWFLVALLIRLDAQLDRRFEGDSILVDVRIGNFPERRTSGSRFEAVPLTDRRLPRRLVLRWYDPPVELRYGDVWRLELKLRRPRGRLNPGGSDVLARHLAAATGATGYVVTGRHNRLLDSAVYGPVGRARARLERRIARVVEEPGQAAVIAAIGIGARHRLSAEQRQRYAASGTSHLMAISGLHIGLAAVSGYGLGRLLFGTAGWGRRPHDAAIIAGLCVAVLYALLSGLAIPARRATLMLMLAALALLKRREVSGAQVLAVTALAVCLVNPLATLSAAFKLSFGAVLLLLVAARQRPAEAGHWSLKPYVAGLKLASAQSTLFLGLLPLSALIFGRVSLAGPLVNFVAIPVFGVVTVPLTLAGLALGGALEPAGNLALVFAARTVGWLEHVIAIAAGEMGSSVVPEPRGLVWLCLLLPLCGLLPGSVPGRPAAWLGAVAVVLWRPGGPAPGCVRIDVLDVGQGLAVGLQTTSHALLYDTGPSFRGGGSTVASTIGPFLESRGIASINRLIVSHADSDHAGGLSELLGYLPVESVLAGDGLGATAGFDACLAGHSWQWDGVRFDILHPDASDAVSGNDASCVLLVSTGEHRALLSGDIEAEAETLLVQRRRLRGVHWLIVPHHGSRTSSTPAFVQSTTPAAAIVSAGYRNRWGMPAAEVVERWQATDSDVWNTAEAGAIGVELCRDGVGPTHGYRHSRGRLWHRLEGHDYF